MHPRIRKARRLSHPSLQRQTSLRVPLPSLGPPYGESLRPPFVKIHTILKKLEVPGRWSLHREGPAACTHQKVP